MKQPTPQNPLYPMMMNDIESGRVKIPQFQREFVWTREKSAHLIDSMLKGFPIGSFVIWRTRETLRSIRNLGGAVLPSTPEGDFTQYVLDGQQRLTSLYAVSKGLKIKRKERVDDYADIYIDLDATADEPMVLINVENREGESLIRVVDLLAKGIEDLAKFPQKYLGKLDEYKRRLQTYQFSIVLVAETPVDIVTEIFTRLNVTGQELSVFEIMVANGRSRTFDSKREFDLAEKYEELSNRLQDVSYETLHSTTILQAVSAMLVKACKKKDILKLDKIQFIEIWPKAVKAIYAAVEYFRSYYRIPVSKLLPYGALIVPFSYFFYNHPDKPVGEMAKRLRDFFWRVSLGGRYSHTLESRLAQDIEKIDEILAGNLPLYESPINTTASFIWDNGWFGTGRSYIKAILCIYSYKLPKSFVDDSLVNISNDFLSRANSKNYHHFFPKGFMNKKHMQEHLIENDLDTNDVNHIANITIVDEFLNKRLIRDKAPSKYMADFKRKNQTLGNTMKSHLIDLDSFGVWEDDYCRFLWSRCQAIAKELRQRIVRQDIDRHHQSVKTDDFEETA